MAKGKPKHTWSGKDLLPEAIFAEVFDEAAAALLAPRIPTLDEHAAYREDPIGWIERFLGGPRHCLVWSETPGYEGHTPDGTPDPLAAICEAVATGWKTFTRIGKDDVRNQYIAVESATGTGKTYLMACLVLWFLACHEDSRVITFGPSEETLQMYLWAEIGKLWEHFQRLFPDAQLMSLRIRMRPGRDDWSASAKTVQVKAGQTHATGAQGGHAKDMLLIVEETPGVDPSILESLKSTATAPHNVVLAVGNPDHVLDTLHRLATTPGTTLIRISALDHPNVVTGEQVIEGATSRGFVAQKAAEHGEDGSYYLRRVRGIVQEQAQEALIRAEWVRAAMRRSEERREELRAIGPRAAGIDLAESQGGDKSALAIGEGSVLYAIQAAHTPEAGQWIRHTIVPRLQVEGIEPKHCGYDATALGSAAKTEFTNAGYPAIPLKGAERLHSKPKRPGDPEFYNDRAAQWWAMRDALRNGEIALPNDEQLLRDLTTPMYSSKGGKILIEAKEDIKKRLSGKSPDVGDAAVLWNWMRLGKGRSALVSDTVRKNPLRLRPS